MVKESENKFDLIVIGSGPGGYVAAIRAAQLGMKTAIIEREHLGGICLNWGCIPTKALLRSAEIYNLAKNSVEYGIKIKGLEFDFKKIIERSRVVSDQLSKGVEYLLKKNEITVVLGHGLLAGDRKINVTKGNGIVETYESNHIILATGARSRSISELKSVQDVLWDYKDAMLPSVLPRSLLVVGSGAIGIEFASFYNTLGVDVTVFELLPRILPFEDEDISAIAQTAFESDGMTIITSAEITSAKKVRKKLRVGFEANGKNSEMNVDQILIAIGIVGNHENIGLENTKIEVSNNHILTNEWSETSEPGVYAIGDVTGPPWLAHKASHEGIICVEKLSGNKNVKPLNMSAIPGCTYCNPQIASLGLTELQAKERGYEIKVGKFPFKGNGKAIALGEPEGLIKTIFDSNTGELLGAHMIGAEVTELIQGYAIAMSLEATEAELMETIFPHPTLSEMMHESVLDAFGKAIHF